MSRRCARVFGVAALAWLVAGCAGEEAGPGEPQAPAREPAPDFALDDLEGRSVRLSDHRGKVVLVDFWATWCPPCLFQVPELNKLWHAHRERGDVEVIGVAIDVEGAEVVAPWVAEQGVDYPIVIGDEKLAHEFGAIGFPTLALVRPDGSLDSLHVGLVEYAELEELVERVRD